MSVFPRLGHIVQRHPALRTGLRWDSLFTGSGRTLAGVGIRSPSLAMMSTAVAGGELPPLFLSGHKPPPSIGDGIIAPFTSQILPELQDNAITALQCVDESIAVDKKKELEAKVAKLESDISAAERKLLFTLNKTEKITEDVSTLRLAKVKTLEALVEALRGTYPFAADADVSREVIAKREALEVAKLDIMVSKVESAVHAAKLKFLCTHPSLEEAAKVIGQITVQLQALRPIKLLRGTLLSNLEVERCNPAWHQQELQRAQEARGMLPFMLEVEMRDAVATLAKAVIRLRPSAATRNVDFETDPFVSPYLRNLRKAEADRDLKKMEILVARAKAELDGHRSRSFRARDISHLESALSRAKVDAAKARVLAAQAAYLCASHDSPNTTVYALAVREQAMTELDVANSEAAVAQARAHYLRANPDSFETDADASSDVRMAKAKLEVEKCNAAVEAARVTFLRHNPDSSRADADVSAEVIAELERLDQAYEDMHNRLQEFEVKVHEAQASLATNALDEVALQIATALLSDVNLSVDSLTEAKTTLNTQLAKRVVKKRKAELAAIRATPHDGSSDRAKREALAELELLKAETEIGMIPLTLKVETLEAKLHSAQIAYRMKPWAVKDDVLSPVHSIRNAFEKARFERDSAAAQNEVRVCEAEVDIAEADFRSKHPDKVLTKADVQTSEEVSKKRMVLKQAKYDALLARVRFDELSRSHKLIFVSGLPPAIELPHPPPTESRKSNAEALTILNKSFANVELPSSLRSGAPFTWSWYERNLRDAPMNDNSAEFLARYVVTEMCVMCDERYPIDISCPLLDSTSDFCIDRISPRTAIVSAINVVRPCDKPFGAPFDSAAYQEMSKQLMTLRQDHGVSAPIGIISSYNEWQLCWHEFATPVAEATTIDAARAASVRAPTPADYRKLCVSEMYSCSDPRLVSLLLSFVLKAYNAPLCDPSDTCWLHYSATDVKFARGGPKRSALKPDQMVRDDATNLYAVTLLSRAGKSAVLQMATESGACCAVMIPRSALSLEERYALMESELGAWQKAYPLEKYPDVKVRMVTLNNSPALVMPFYAEISEDDWDNPDTLRMVESHLKELALRGVFHHSIMTSNFVWAKDREDVRLIGWGLASGAPNSSKDDESCNVDAAAFVERSMRKLRHCLRRGI